MLPDYFAALGNNPVHLVGWAGSEQGAHFPIELTCMFQNTGRTMKFTNAM